MTIKQSLITGRGETFTLNMLFKDSLGAPVNLNGHAVEIQVRKAGSGEPVGTYPADVDSTGHITIKVSDEVTDVWPVGKLAYVVNHTTPDGDEKWLMYGPLTVNDGVRV